MEERESDWVYEDWSKRFVFDSIDGKLIFEYIVRQKISRDLLLEKVFSGKVIGAKDIDLSMSIIINEILKDLKICQIMAESLHPGIKFEEFIKTFLHEGLEFHDESFSYIIRRKDNNDKN